MAYMIEVLHDGGPNHPLFHPCNWYKDPQRWKNEEVRALPHEFVLDHHAAMRGYPVPVQRIPKQMRLWSNHKKLPHFVEFTRPFWGVSEAIKEMLEAHANVDCELIPISILPKKTGPPSAQKYYWLNVIRRLDSIIWDKSSVEFSMGEFVDDMGNARHGLDVSLFSLRDQTITVNASVIRGANIWHETFKDTIGGSLIFISD
jgi:hypothetical protein